MATMVTQERLKVMLYVHSQFCSGTEQLHKFKSNQYKWDLKIIHVVIKLKNLSWQMNLSFMYVAM
jgi:hypothetical protein